MEFEDIINDFHLNLDKILKSIPNDEYTKFITFTPLNLYKKSMSKTRSFNNLYNTINQDINIKFKEYKNDIEDIENDTYHFNLNQKEILNYNLDNIEKDLKDKTINLNNQIIELEKKEFIISSKYRDTINEIDIDKNLINLQFNSYLPDIKQHYNISKEIFAKETSLKNDQSHAKVSKDLYILNDSDSKKIDELNKKIEKNLKSIKNIEDEIETRKKRVNDEILKKEVELNNTINDLTIKNNEQKKLNDIQTNIVIESINLQLNEVIEKYNKKKQKLSLKHQEKFQELDNLIDNETFKFNQEFDILKKRQALLRFKAEKKYNDTILKNSSSLYNRNTKLLNKLAFKEFQLFNKTLENEVEFKKKEFKNNIDKLRMQKYILVNRRKYDAQILELDENEEKYKLEKQINTAINEKNRFIKKLDNDLSKIVNRYRLGFDIEKNNINKNYKLFELSRKQSIKKLNLVINQTRNIKEKYESKNKLTNDFFRNRDTNKQKLNYLDTILNIEKNKYLVKFNNLLIDIKSEFNNNNSSFEKDCQECLYNKSINFINEEIKYINNCKNYFIKHSSLIKTDELNNYSKEIFNNNISKQISVIDIKNKFKINKLNLDINLFNSLFKYNQDIQILYGKVINQTINIVVKYVKNHLTNCEYIVSVLNNLSNIYIHFLNEFNTSTFNLAKKILNSRVSFEVGNKYSLEIENINNKYDKIIKKLEEKKNVCNTTLLNYKLHMLELKAKIDLNSRKIVDDRNIKNKIIKIKENFIYSKNLKKINKLIKDMEQIITNINSSIARNNAIKLLEYAKIETAKNADFIINNQAILKLDILFDKILESTNSLYNIFSFKKIVIFKKLNKNYPIFKKKIILNSSYSLMKSNKIINDFYFNELKSISINKNNNINYYKNIEDNNIKEFNKNKKRSSLNIIQNNEEYRLMNFNHKTNIKNIENNYYKELDIKKNNFEIKNNSLNNKLNEIKKEYFKIFNSCDKNSSHIINSLINENNLIKDNYDKTLINNEKKCNTNNKLLQKEYYHFLTKCKKDKILIKKLADFTQKDLKNECISKNNKLDTDNKELEANAKLEVKIDLKELELYSIKTKNSKIKERKTNIIEIKNIKKDFKNRVERK